MHTFAKKQKPIQHARKGNLTLYREQSVGKKHPSHPIIDLQRMVGNRVVQQYIKSGGSSTSRSPAIDNVIPTSGSRLQRQQPMDPRHARGYAGEQGMGFALYRAEDGWVFIRGPSGSQGHGVTTSGEDGLAYNVRTKELHIIDNKSLARRGNVGSATAIDPQRNLLNNLDDMIRHVESQPPERLPYRQRVLRLLRQTRAALKGGGPIPGRVKLVVTNVGGRSTGVTQRLASQGVTFRDVSEPTDVPGTKRPSLTTGSQSSAPSAPKSSTTPGTAGTPSPAVTAAPPSVKPASPAMVRQRARLLATLQKQVSQSTRQAARARLFASSVGRLLEGLAMINTMSDALSIAAHGTTMPEVEKQANQVVSQSRSAVSFSESVAENTSILEAVASVSDALERGDAEALMDLSTNLSDFENEIRPIGEEYEEIANQLEARAKGLNILSDLMWKAAHIPSGGSTAGQASALAMHISLQRLAGRLNTAANNYRKASDSLLFRSRYFGGLAYEANQGYWKLFWEHVKKVLEQQAKEKEAQKREAASKKGQASAQVGKPPKAKVPKKPQSPTYRTSIWDHGQQALRQARSVRQKGGGATYEERKAASDELWLVIGRIEQLAKRGFAHAEEEFAMKNLKGQLFEEVGKLMK